MALIRMPFVFARKYRESSFSEDDFVDFSEDEYVYEEEAEDERIERLLYTEWLWSLDHTRETLTFEQYQEESRQAKSEEGKQAKCYDFGEENGWFLDKEDFVRTPPPWTKVCRGKSEDKEDVVEAPPVRKAKRENREKCKRQKRHSRFVSKPHTFPIA
jgi:hypothetical protein